jgi:bifunctional DNA-binding transcriptional regulator/antitoxin component of YhaV-PrlF toxin-antitoxin module
MSFMPFERNCSSSPNHAISPKSQNMLKACSIVEVAKITNHGQVTIPTYMQTLEVKECDKIAFIEDGGHIEVADSAKIALANIRAAFKGEAERLGLKDEQDVVALVDEVREQMWKERYEGND